MRQFRVSSSEFQIRGKQRVKSGFAFLRLLREPVLERGVSITFRKGAKSQRKTCK